MHSRQLNRGEQWMFAYFEQIMKFAETEIETSFIKSIFILQILCVGYKLGSIPFNRFDECFVQKYTENGCTCNVAVH